MKKFLKIFGIVIASILVFLLLLTFTAKIFQDDIAKAALKRVSKEINAPVEIESVDFNLVRKFPLSTIEFNNLWLKDPDSTKQDTIAGIKHLYVSVNSREIIRGNYEVKKVVLDGLKLHYEINKDTVSNVDFLMALLPESSSEPDTLPDTTTLYMNLESLLLKNLSCSYFDGTSNTGARIQIPEVSLKGNILDDYYTAETNGNITITDVAFGEYKLNLMQKASLDFNLDYRGDSILINTFTFATNGIDLSAEGWAYSGEHIFLNTSIKNGEFDLGILSHYLPDDMMQEFGLKSAQGIFRFNSEIKGEYIDENNLPRVDANFSFSNGAIKTTDYPEVKHFSFNGTASNGHLKDNSTTRLNLKSLVAETAESRVELQAKIVNIDQPIYDIYSKGKLNIGEFKAFIPEEEVKSLDGIIKWELGTKGELPAEIGDDFTDYAMARSWANISLHQINANIDDTLSFKNLSGQLSYKPESFKVSKLEIEVPPYDVHLKNISTDMAFNGSVNDIDNMAVDVKNLHAEFDRSCIDMQASLSNLTDPDYEFYGDIKLNLSNLKKFAPDTLVHSMRGYMNAKINSAGYINLDSIETQAPALAFENTNIDLLCQNVEIIMVDTLMEIKNFDLAMMMKPDTISLKNLSGNYKGLDFAIKNTEIINAYNSAYLNQADTLKVITDIEIGDVDYALFEPFMMPADTTPDTTETITNYKMDIKGSLAVNSFSMADYEVDSTMTIKQLNMENISTLFRVTDSTYIADSLEFNAFGGYMLTSARYDYKPGGRTVASIKNHIDGMDFKQLLYDMDNFGQEDLTYKNLSGQLFSDIDAEITMLGDSIPMDKIKTKATFTLTNGGIYNFEPAIELSKFTGINELDNIKFQTLNTQLFIHKGAAYVPETHIVSSAIDLKAFGMQSFGEDYEYHLELNIGDVLTGKRDKLMARQAKAARNAGDKVDRNGVNLLIYSLDGKTKNGFDNKKSMTRMKTRITLKNGALSLVFFPEQAEYNTRY